MKKFDILTPLGIGLGLLAITLAIINIAELEGIVAFISIAAILTVMGGLLGSLLVNFSFTDIKTTFSAVLGKAFYQEDHDLEELIETFVQLSSKARREGLLALEQEVEDIEDPFIKKGILLAVDGLEPELIKEIMMAEVAAMEERHGRGRQILEKAGELSPAWGMIGTIVGLVLMLQTLEEPETLGPRMAVALITTMYGAILANLFFIPIAGKLETMNEQEVFMKQIVIEGVLGVQSGQNPRILEEKLSAFLPANKRNRNNEEVEEGAAVDEL